MSARDIRLDEAITNAVFALLKDYGMSVDVDAFHAALTAAGYAVDREWQDISTAPRDGTEVLLWCAPHSESELDSVFAAAWTVDDDDDKGTWIIPQADDREGGWSDTLKWNPTHWRPLPAPPAGEATP